MKLNRIILAPDSFKGTLSAADVCEIESEIIRRIIPGAEIYAIPMADGGEGMVDSYLGILGGERVSCRVTGPLGEPVTAVYGMLSEGKAIMEMAQAAGLPLVMDCPNPMKATTYGVGEMILDAVSRGTKHILLGLGGSATNDCGIGMAAALGYSFYDSVGDKVEPLAVNMANIRTITAPTDLPHIDVVAACDVDNPLTGSFGATYTFGPQKGADADMLASLENGMCNIGKLMKEQLSVDTVNIPGAGAAGGMGAAVLAFLNGRLQSGVEMLLDVARFDELLAGVDLVITGEGRLDRQSMHGKVPAGVAKRCMKHGVKCIALCGSLGSDPDVLRGMGLSECFAATNGERPLEEIQRTCREDLASLTESVIRKLI